MMIPIPMSSIPSVAAGSSRITFRAIAMIAKEHDNLHVDHILGDIGLHGIEQFHRNEHEQERTEHRDQFAISEKPRGTLARLIASR